MNITPNIIDAGDVLIVGAGLAGLFTALQLAPRKVTILAASKLEQGTASAWAQGGIAAAIGADDTPQFHIDDTIMAGDGLVDPNIAHMIAHEAPQRIDDLLRLGVRFDRHPDGTLSLGREAAHSHHRIVSVEGDRTGHALMSVLQGAVHAAEHIDIIEYISAYELALEDNRVVGIFARATTNDKTSIPLLLRARHIILAMGGVGHLYQITTNPEFANGEALAMAARAGATLTNLEFVQFHPTAFTGLGDPAPLATEALRGEGAQLVNGKHERFMPQRHQAAELAPRDIVARAVFHEIEKTGAAGLDLHCGGDIDLASHLAEKFPTVWASCKAAGIDPLTQILPIAPAAHYHMGGIATDEFGRTNIEGLWICGEAAHTGAHGANRLASNSLLEALVFGNRIAAHINNHSTPLAATRVEQPRNLKTYKTSAKAVDELRHIMSHYVGVTRTAKGLHYALSQIQKLWRLSIGHARLSNMCDAALLIAAAAYQRQESRGAHFREDFPHRQESAQSHNINLNDAIAISREALSAETQKEQL